MAKIFIKKRINNSLLKNKSNIIKLNIGKSKIISLKSKASMRKKKKIKKINNKKNYSDSSNLMVYNNIDNNIDDNIDNNNIKSNSPFFNIYNGNILNNDIFYSMRCYTCRYIPLIKIKYNQTNFFQNKEIFLENKEDFAMVECSCIKGHNIITSLKTYLIYCKIKHNFLTLCEGCHQSKPYELFDFSFCKKCKKIICLKCLVFHNHKKDYANNLLEKSEVDDNDDKRKIDDKNKNIISINELEFFCQNHKKKYDSFCEDCMINFCKECKINHNKNHKLIQFDNILLNDEEIKNIEYNIDLAKKRLFLFENKILKFIHSLYRLEKLHQQFVNLYNFFISIYKDEISFAEVILSFYKEAKSRNKYNFQIIQNIRNLKFNIRGIPIKNSYDFTTNIKSLTSYLSNYKNLLLLDIKNYYTNKRIIKARIKAAAKRIRSKIHLNNLKKNEVENMGSNDNVLIDNKINCNLEINNINGKDIQNN